MDNEVQFVQELVITWTRRHCIVVLIKKVCSYFLVKCYVYEEIWTWKLIFIIISFSIVCFFTDKFLLEAEKNFGVSSTFIASLKRSGNEITSGTRDLSEVVIEETKSLTTCDFEKNTLWGKEASAVYLYHFFSFNLWITIIFVWSYNTFVKS